MFDKLRKSAEEMKDRVAVQADELKDRVADQVDKHEDQINAGLDKAGNFVDQKTGGKYADKIASGKERVRGGLDRLDDDDTPPGPTSAS